jgi:DNA-binding ferritin-like protein
MAATEARKSQLKEQEKQVSQMRKKMHKVINERVDVVVEAFVKHIGQYAEVGDTVMTLTLRAMMCL